MAFETVTLDMATTDFLSVNDITGLCGAPLRSWVTTGIAAVAASMGTPVEKVETRLIKTTGFKGLQAADDEDLRESLRVLRTWLNDPASYIPPARRPRVQRPEGIGQLPVPRTAKQAHADTTCALCADSVKTSDLIGRMRVPKDERLHVAMGWLCAHCLYERREKPRRRDVLLRIFHHLFASSAVNLNAYECDVLQGWLTEDRALALSPAWKKDPLETTLARLNTSAAEGKATTWIAVPTARTIIAVLHAAPASSPAEADVLAAIAQHLDEWATNPQRVEARKYGTGTHYRARVLALTDRPTVLSERGGPFDLHQAPPAAETTETADSTA